MNTIKNGYAAVQSSRSKATERLGRRLFNTYNRISLGLVGEPLAGVNVDLGAGNRGFSCACEERGVESHPLDYPDFDLESSDIPLPDGSVDFATMNAVMEHIASPGHTLSEVRRTLRRGGLLFIRTPNWRIDYRDFYNDPTHVKPYTPKSLRLTLSLSSLSPVFIEPGLVERAWFWWRLPDSIKWTVASHLRGGTKSIIAVART